MGEFDDKLNAILSNPQMMQQIMAMAGSFSQQASPPPREPEPPGLSLDPGAMQGMLELLRGTQLDRRQHDLLTALGAYLPPDKVGRLQKAMQASRVAKLASTALNKKGGK